MRRLIMTAVLTIALLGAVPVAGTANEGVVGDLELLGEVGIATGTLFDGVEVGGISAIAHVGGDSYLALSDDRSEIAPARFYDLEIDVSDGSLDEGDVAIVDSTELSTPGFGSFPPLSIDPEGLAIGRGGSIYISSEGDALAGLGPFVNKFGPDGRQAGRLPVDDHFAPGLD
ncbi:MAG: esterase-like activity of phytase family protein, partial [Acidimicrobiia bacterium]|nr:esterase-like activity of phytase family protein [Acidimicrobiia bacterium]